jgi:hypothetical protein
VSLARLFEYVVFTLYLEARAASCAGRTHLAFKRGLRYLALRLNKAA